MHTKIIIFLFFVLLLALPLRAAELVTDTVTFAKAIVLEVRGDEVKQVPGTDVSAQYQTIVARVLDGPEVGKEISIENDYLKLAQGDVFYLTHTVSQLDGRDYYAVSEPYRLPALYFFIGLFVVCVIAFGGIQGVRGLVSLCGSFVLILFVLLPGILNGYSPVLLSLGVAALITILGSYITHGFNKTTSAAVVGMLFTIAITGVLAYAAVASTRLSGFDSDESVYLNLHTRGAIDFQGLLLGGILIGLLGVLYDAAIGQAVVVEELAGVGKHLSRGAVFARALRVGREHIGALVDSLAIAYVGAALPLLLLFYASGGAPFLTIINREIFATEIIRIMVGSIGLILAVPITTAVSAVMLVSGRDGAIEKSTQTP